MRKVFEWIKGWYNTLKFRLLYPEAYHRLCDILDTAWDEEDFIEVQRPNFRTWEQYKADNPDFPSFQLKDGEGL
jgi:hypothetical protein